MTAATEPRWPEGTVLALGKAPGGYLVGADGVPVLFGRKPTTAPLDSPRWWVVGQLIPDGHRSVPDEVCERVARLIRSEHQRQLEDDPRRVILIEDVPALEMADILDPPAPEPPVEYVSIDGWEPNEAIVAATRALATDPTTTDIEKAIAVRALRVIEVQLADGKVLRP